jgi:hypothetical protein
MIINIIILFKDFGMVSAKHKIKTHSKNMRSRDVDEKSN